MTEPIIVRVRQRYTVPEFRALGKRGIEDKYLNLLVGRAEALYLLKSKHVNRDLCVVKGHINLTPLHPLHAQGELIYFILSALKNLHDCEVGEFYLTNNWKQHIHYLDYGLVGLHKFGFTHMGDSLLNDDQALLCLAY